MQMFKYVLTMVTLAATSAPFAGAAELQRHFQLDMTLTHLSSERVPAALILNAGEANSLSAALDLSDLKIEPQGQGVSLRGRVRVDDRALPRNPGDLFLGVDLNGNGRIDGDEPRVREFSQFRAHIGESSSDSGTRPAFFEVSCPCAGGRIGCMTSVVYSVSILERATNKRLWGDETHEAVMTRSCDVTLVLGKHVPLPSAVTARPARELVARLQTKSYTQLVPLHFPANGQQGPKGDQGPPGERGAQGDAGAKGEQGERGAPGESGPQGERGEPGPAGPVGPPGPQGPAGPMGPAGPVGPQGVAGPQGTPGSADVSISEASGSIRFRTPTYEGVTMSEGRINAVVSTKADRQHRHNLEDIIGSVAPCVANGNAPFCWEGQRLRVGNAYFSRDSATRAATDTVVLTGYVTGTVINAWEQVGKLALSSRTVITVAGSVERDDGVLVPVNVTPLAAVRVRGGALEVKVEDPRLIQRSLILKIEMANTEGVRLSKKP